MAHSVLELLPRLTVPFELRRFLADLLRAAGEASGARRLLLILPSSTGGRVAAAEGRPAHSLLEPDELRALGPVLKGISENGEVLHIPDTLRENRKREFNAMVGMGISTVAAARVGREGALVAYRTDGLALDPSRLTDYARLASLAEEIARLRSEQPRDPLTGTLSVGFFMTRLGEEVARCGATGRPLSLLFLDPLAPLPTASTGPLPVVAALLRTLVPHPELVARHLPALDRAEDARQGDEFYVLLPDLPRPQVLALAGKIRAALDSSSAGLTAIGIASIPEEADSVESLLLSVATALDLSRAAAGAVSLPTGAVDADSLPAPEVISLPGTREGRILGATLLRIFESDLDLRVQLDLAASFIGTLTDGESVLLQALDSEGTEFATGRHQLSEEEVRALLPVMRLTAVRREPYRSEGVPGIAIPIQHGGAVCGALHFQNRQGEVSPLQEGTLRSLASSLGSVLSASMKYRRRNEETETRRTSIARAVAEIRERYDFSAIVGEGEKLSRTLQLVARAAETDAPVLILGESGTGKELIARAVHANSPRRSGPFVVLNCAALPMNLLESGLFGHVKGAFTGAIQDRAGAFESAHQGTLFLDEIGELPLETQAKLLRAIQFGEVQHVGSDSVVRVNTRVVAATNRNLQQEIRAKRFREDLFFRINVFQIEVPPLREHLEDLPAIVRHTLTRISSEMKRRMEIAPEALEALSRYSYPGNVRELENILLRASAVAAGNTITVRDLSDPLQGESVSPHSTSGIPRTAEEFQDRKEQAIREVSDRIELEFLRNVLTRTGGNVSEASRLTGFNRTSLQKLLTKHKLDSDVFRKPS